MATILIDRYSATEDSVVGRGVYNVISGIEEMLMARYNVLRMPPHRLWAEEDVEVWLRSHALHANLYLGHDMQIIKFLRYSGWQGKVIFNILGDLPRGGATLRNALPYLYKTDVIWFANTADRQIYETLIKHDGTQPAAVVLPYGIDCDLFTPLDQITKQHFKQAWGLTPDDFVVIYAGRITIEKNFHSLLEALSQLVFSGINLKLIVAGRILNVPFREFKLREPNLASKIQQIIEDLNLSNQIKFIPWLDRAFLNTLYNVGDVFVNLTLHHDEQFGYAQLEAMSAGLPVIGSAWGGLKDTIIDGKSGFLIDTWMTDYGVRIDTPRLINTLKLLMNNQALYQKLSAFAVQHVREFYSWPIYRKRFLELVDTLLNCVNEESQAKYSEFGSFFHKKFSMISMPLEENFAVYPIYKTLPNQYYSHLLSFYTSLGKISFSSEANFFSALTGNIKDTLFVSSDLLWPVNIQLDDQESQIMRQLSRFSTITRDKLICSDDIINTLVQKGLIGMSRE